MEAEKAVAAREGDGDKQRGSALAAVMVVAWYLA